LERALAGISFHASGGIRWPNTADSKGTRSVVFFTIPSDTDLIKFPFLIRHDYIYGIIKVDGSAAVSDEDQNSYPAFLETSVPLVSSLRKS